MIETPEKVNAYLDTKAKKEKVLPFVKEETKAGIARIASKHNWMERRSTYRFKIAKQVNEDLAFKFLNDSLENFGLAQNASMNGLKLMNDLLTMGLTDPINFNGKKFSDLASGMKVIFEEARLYSGNPTENINIANTSKVQTDETKNQLDELLVKIDDLKDIQDNDIIIEAEVVKNNNKKTDDEK